MSADVLSGGGGTLYPYGKVSGVDGQGLFRPAFLIPSIVPAIEAWVRAIRCGGRSPRATICFPICVHNYIL